MHSNWETNFFRGIALESWRRCIDLFLDTKAEAGFLERTLQVPAGAPLLDIPCGSGRHARELAARGYRMTGIDLSEESLEEARQAAPAVRWIHGDIREIAWMREFAGAYCFGNSFGYLDGAEAPRFLADVGRALKPGARFVLETGMAAESILPTLERNRWFQLGDLYMLSRNSYDAAESRLDIEYTFIRGSEIETRPSASYVFTVRELCRMHAEAGLRVEQLLASTSGASYQLGSPCLIMVSQAT